MAFSPDSVGKTLKPITFEYKPRDVIIYALGVGCGPDELEFCYENGLKVLPTFAVIPAFNVMAGMIRMLKVNPMMILHGEQRIEIHNPIPTAATLTTEGKLSHIWDKGKGAVVGVEAITKDKDGKHIFTNIFSMFARGAGGFGGERGPSGDVNVPPDREPDFAVDYTIPLNQGLIYALSGDINPLHRDPKFAKMAGYDKPILHGLCTYGHVGRAILHNLCGSDPDKFKSFEVRFKGAVYPGDTVTVQIWKDGDGKAIVQAVTQKGDVALGNAAVTYEV